MNATFLLTIGLLCLQLRLGVVLLAIKVFFLELELSYLQMKLFCLRW